MAEHIATFSKTRIAPTPSGYLHLGNVLSFAITAALAKKHGAKILLRIDDLDRDRVNPLYVQDIFDTLHFLEIPYDEGPRDFADYESNWSQIHRMEMYCRAVQQLKDNNDVFACSCSRTQIRNSNGDDIYPGNCRHKNILLDAENVSWRLKTDKAEQLNIKTLQGDIIKTHLPPAMQNFVVRKKDGYPSYQLTSVLDDVYYGVDLIVRGQDLWASTLAQIYLAPHIGAGAFRDVTFYHHPLLVAPDNEKLSKSAGATSVYYLRKEGKKPTDVYNAIAKTLGFEQPLNKWEDLGGLVDIFATAP